MNNGKRIIHAIVTACAILSGPALAGETPINNGPGFPKPAPTPPPDLSYLCLAGIGGSSKVLYLTANRPDDWPYDRTGTFIQRTVNAAWMQAMHGQPSALNAHCEEMRTTDIQRVRQEYVDQANKFGDRVVDVDWHYGQEGAAVIAH